MGDLESFGDSTTDANTAALDAISDFVRSLPELEGDMVQRFVLIVETIDQDDRWLSTFTAPGQKAWDTMGLLDYGLTMERNVHLDTDDD